MCSSFAAELFLEHLGCSLVVLSEATMNGITAEDCCGHGFGFAVLASVLCVSTSAIVCCFAVLASVSGECFSYFFLCLLSWLRFCVNALANFCCFTVLASVLCERLG